jgi:hypothetical protein
MLDQITEMTGVSGMQRYEVSAYQTRTGVFTTSTTGSLVTWALGRCPQQTELCAPRGAKTRFRTPVVHGKSAGWRGKRKTRSTGLPFSSCSMPCGWEGFKLQDFAEENPFTTIQGLDGSGAQA